MSAEELIRTDTERLCLEALREAAVETDGPMERHCFRVFLLCEMLADKHNADLDREVTLCAALLHDIGLYDSVSDGGVYTEEGGDLARSIALEAGWDQPRAELCAEACARHHSTRAQWDLGAEVEVLRLADRIDVIGFPRAGLSRAQIKSTAEQFSREGFYGGLLHTVWPSLRSRPLQTAKIFKP